MSRPHPIDDSPDKKSQDLPPLRIVIVQTVMLEEPPPAELHAQLQRIRALHAGLLQAGYHIIASLPGDLHLPERLARLEPDLIIIDAESDARDVLEYVVVATRDAPRPIALFTEDGDRGRMAAAMEAGVTAYVVAGLQPERVKPVLDVAMARFHAEQKLRHELQDAKIKLAERKIVEKAKGLLMQRQQLSEEAAYAKLRSMAMERKLKLAVMAQRLLDAADLLA
jgi:response regulator NasT